MVRIWYYFMYIFVVNLQTTPVTQYNTGTQFNSIFNLLPWRCRGTHRQLHHCIPPTITVHCDPCGVMQIHPDLITILLYAINPSLLWPSPAPLSMYISVQQNLRIPFIFHSADVSEVSQPTLSDSLVDIFVVVQPCINLYIPYPVHTCNAFYLS